MGNARKEDRWIVLLPHCDSHVSNIPALLLLDRQLSVVAELHVEAFRASNQQEAQLLIGSNC